MPKSSKQGSYESQFVERRKKVDYEDVISFPLTGIVSASETGVWCDTLVQRLAHVGLGLSAGGGGAAKVRRTSE